jgi:hypothetical protein
MINDRHKVIIILLLIFFAIGLAGCVTTSRQRISEVMDSWKGSHQSKLIASSWGPQQGQYLTGKEELF